MNLSLHRAPGAPLLRVGHRGAKGHAPENTMLSFMMGADMGVTAVETDVHLSKDGEVVADPRPYRRPHHGWARLRQGHDSGGAQEAGCRKLVRCAFRRGAHSDLDGVAGMGQGSGRRRHRDQERADLLSRHRGEDDPPGPRARHGAPGHPDQLRPFRACARPNRSRRRSPRASSMSAGWWTRWPRPAPRWRTPCIRTGPSSRRELVRTVHEAGLAISPWNPNDLPTLRMLSQMGVDSVGTDYPELFGQV